MSLDLGRAEHEPPGSTFGSLAPALRAAFPHAGPHERAPYCVGAAVGHYVGARDDPFPAENELACHLEEVRGFDLRASLGKPRKGFLRRAKLIIGANDAGDTESAWQLLEASLRGLPLDTEKLALARSVAAEWEEAYGVDVPPATPAAPPPVRAST